ncbi:MAG: hypothetical protein ACYC4Q_04025 [Victivallaceae bacterium]
MKKIVLSVIIMLLFADLATAAGDTQVRFHLGWVISSEISRRQVTVLNQMPYAFEEPSRNKAYAIVSVKLDSGRTLSIYDFSLIINEKKYPCVALRTGISDFNAANWQIQDTSPKEIYSMLFIVDYPDLEYARDIKLNFRYNLAKNQAIECLIPFKNLNSGDFTPVTTLMAEDTSVAPVSSEINSGKK